MWWKTSQNHKEISKECTQWECGIWKSVKKPHSRYEWNRYWMVCVCECVSLRKNHNFETPTMCEHWLCFSSSPFRMPFVCFLVAVSVVHATIYLMVQINQRLYNNIWNLFIHEPKFIHPSLVEHQLNGFTFSCLFASCFCLRWCFVCRFFRRPRAISLGFCFSPIDFKESDPISISTLKSREKCVETCSISLMLYCRYLLNGISKLISTAKRSEEKKLSNSFPNWCKPAIYWFWWNKKEF